MEEMYLLGILPPGEALRKIEPVREELYRRLRMPSARLLPDLIPVALFHSYPEPPKDTRYRVRVEGDFTLDPVPVCVRESVFLPLVDSGVWEKTREDPLIGPPPSGAHAGGHRTPSPFPGVFLGFSSELPSRPADGPSDRFSPHLPRASGPISWKKSSLACLRVLLADRAAGGTVIEALWEIFWEVSVMGRT